MFIVYLFCLLFICREQCILIKTDIQQHTCHSLLKSKKENVRLFDVMQINVSALNFGTILKILTN